MPVMSAFFMSLPLYPTGALAATCLPLWRNVCVEDSALRRRFYAALKQAKIKHLRFHDLRHSFGTLAVQVFPLSDVKAYMGHADIATTMIYVHHVPQHDAAAKLSTALRVAASPAIDEMEGSAVDRGAR